MEKATKTASGSRKTPLEAPKTKKSDKGKFAASETVPETGLAVASNSVVKAPVKAPEAPRVYAGIASAELGENWGAEEEAGAEGIEPVRPKRIRRLDSTVKKFIVVNNACGRRPSEVVRDVKEVFDLTVSDALVQCYDPTKAQGQTLSLELKQLFRTAQREYQTMVLKAGIADQRWRLQQMHVIAQRALDQGNNVMALKALEQAAKDEGGVYSRVAPTAGVDDKRVALAQLLKVRPEDLPALKALAQEKRADAPV